MVRFSYSQNKVVFNDKQASVKRQFYSLNALASGFFDLVTTKLIYVEMFIIYCINILYLNSNPHNLKRQVESTTFYR